MGATVRKATAKRKGGGSTSIASNWQRIFRQAIRSMTSDIHIEPQADVLYVRYRQGGILSPPEAWDCRLTNPLAIYLKQLAGLDETQISAPQAGIFLQAYNHKSYSCGITTLPLATGERLVIHIQDPMTQPPTLEELGLWGKGLAYTRQALATKGLIILTGPKQSGLSTTLASCTAAVAHVATSVASVEAASRFHIPEVRYMNVNPAIGMTWPRVMNLQLKSRPDVVILGGVPDRETAALALDAARHNQLIVCGIPADSAAMGFQQLVLISGDKLTLAARLQLIVNQRLLPRLCENCRQICVPTMAQQQDFVHRWHLDQAQACTRLRHALAAAAQSGLLPLSDYQDNLVSNRGIAKVWQPKPNGCRRCGYSGFYGVVGLFEVIPAEDSLRSQLANSGARQLTNILGSARLSSLAEDGFVKAVSGLCSLEAAALLQ